MDTEMKYVGTVLTAVVSLWIGWSTYVSMLVNNKINVYKAEDKTTIYTKLSSDMEMVGLGKADLITAIAVAKYKLEAKIPSAELDFAQINDI